MATLKLSGKQIYIGFVLFSIAILMIVLTYVSFDRIKDGAKDETKVSPLVYKNNFCFDGSLLRERESQNVFVIHNVSNLSLRKNIKLTPQCTGSMMPTIQCGDSVNEYEFNQSDKLEIGKIYVYDSSGSKWADGFSQYPNGTQNIMHRLIGCFNENCSLLIFKGDANILSEIVTRESIKYKVWSIEI
jgi:hypothetical protein